jgi:thiamine-phosphate pyrophosphorylase
VTALPPGFYGIADAAFGDPIRQWAVLAEAGTEVIQLRLKGWTTEARVEAGRRCVRGPLMIVNDDAAAASALGAWVHLGQGDGETALAHGRSTHDVQQVQAAAGARYIGFGPVFGTATKRDALLPRGLSALAEAVAVSRVPVVAIGGVTPERVEQVAATGVHGWTAIAAVWAAADPIAVIRALARPRR